jgi:hypothetical protein
MISNNEFKAIADLDLDPIKVKLMHKESGEGWTLEYANTIEFEYRRFLYLMKKFPNEPAAPLFDVDVFWHYHILDTMKYAVDCDSVFGYFLHHFPYVGLRDEDDEVTHQRAGIRMQELYEGTFDEPYLRVTSAAGQVAVDGAAKSAYSWVVSQEALAAARKTAYSWVVSQDAVAVARKTAYSWVVSQDAVAAARKTAYSWVVSQDAVAAAGETGYSWPVSKEALAASAKPAYSWIVSQEAVAAAGMPMAVAADLPVDLAALRRLYFERPVLAAA